MTEMEAHFGHAESRAPIGQQSCKTAVLKSMVDACKQLIDGVSFVISRTLLG